MEKRIVLQYKVKFLTGACAGLTVPTKVSFTSMDILKDHVRSLFLTRCRQGYVKAIITSNEYIPGEFEIIENQFKTENHPERSLVGA